MRNTSRGDDMRSALERVGKAIDKWYEERCERRDDLETLKANDGSRQTILDAG